MKVLRRHHGFTTNSSASSEWTNGPVGPTTPPGWKPPVPAATPQPTSPAGGQALPGPAPAAPQPGQATQPAEPQPGAASRPSLLWDNLLVIGGLLLAILGVIAVERMVRRWLRRRRQSDV